MRRSSKIALAVLIAATLTSIGVWHAINLSMRSSCDFSSPDYQAQSVIRLVASGLDQYKLKHGQYPIFNEFKSMVDNDSVLVRENLIPANSPSVDPAGKPFFGKSTPTEFHVAWPGRINCTHEKVSYQLAP